MTYNDVSMQPVSVILLVDNDEEIIDFLRLIIGEEGDFIVATDGRQAVEMLGQRPLQLVVTGGAQLRKSFKARTLNGGEHAANDDARFVKRLTDFVLNQIDNEELGPDHLADAMNMSRMTLYRKLKSSAGLSPHELINTTRLNKAAAMLSSGEYKIFEVVMSVGYKSTTHFGKLFHKQFGMSPTQFVQSNNGKGGR